MVNLSGLGGIKMGHPRIIKNVWGSGVKYINSKTLEDMPEQDKYIINELTKLQSTNTRIIDIKPACTDKYTINFHRSDFKPDPDYYGYSIVIHPESFDSKDVSYCSVLIEGGEDGLQINRGIIDDIAYMVIYKENGDIVINTKTPDFDGTAVIDTPRIYAAKVLFEKESWQQDGSSWYIRIHSNSFGIKKVYCANVLIKFGDNDYVENHGILDDIDYVLIHDGDGEITIISKSPFAGKILIKGDI